MPTTKKPTQAKMSGSKTPDAVVYVVALTGEQSKVLAAFHEKEDAEDYVVARTADEDDPVTGDNCSITKVVLE